MDKDQYQALQTQMLLAAGLVADWDLDDMIKAIVMADTLGPVLDPALWIRGRQQMDEIKELALAFKKVQTVTRKIRATAEQRYLGPLEQGNGND